jgi:LPS-assembly protein
VNLSLSAASLSPPARNFLVFLFFSLRYALLAMRFPIILRSLFFPLFLSFSLRSAFCALRFFYSWGEGSNFNPGMRMSLGRWWVLISSLLAFHLLAFLPGAHSQGIPSLKYEASREPWRLRADSASFDQAANTYVAEGRVEIWQETQRLTADRVVVNAATREAEATGNVTLVKGEDSIKSQRMVIDLNTNLGMVVEGTLFLKNQNYYLRGEEIERVGENTYRVKRGSFTTCNGDWPAWRFTGSEALITLEEYADVWGATFQVKNIPILYSPYLFFPVKTQRQSGFLFPRIGFSDTAGAQLGLSYFWAMARNMDATLYLDLASRKGIGEGIEYRYVRREESSGSLYGYHIREGEEYRKKYTDPLDRKPERWQVDFRHDEYLDPSFFAKTRLKAFSDRQYFVDYGSTYGDQSSEQAYSFLSLTKNWERFSLFGEARRTVDLRQEDKTTLQYYPLTNFVGIRQPLFSSPLFFSFESGYGYFWRDLGTTGHRVDLYPRVSLPLKWGGLEFNTELGGRETWYAGVSEGNESRGRQLWDFQTGVATDLYRVFDTGSKDVPKVKHVFRPEVTYLYIPDVDQTDIPYYDQPVPKTNALFYGFTNRIIGKIVEGSTTRYQEYVYFKVGQKYDINEITRSAGSSSEPRKPFGVIAAELRIRDSKYITLENITNYDPNSNNFQTAYTTFGLNDWRGDGLTLEHSWRKGIEEQLNGTLRVRAFSFLDFSYGKRYSLFGNQNLETNYGAVYRHQCWSLEVNYTERAGAAGAPSEKKLWFMFNLQGLASVGKK